MTPDLTDINAHNDRHFRMASRQRTCFAMTDAYILALNYRFRFRVFNADEMAAFFQAHPRHASELLRCFTRDFMRRRPLAVVGCQHLYVRETFDGNLTLSCTYRPSPSPGLGFWRFSLEIYNYRSLLCLYVLTHDEEVALLR
jgi:hypothetical protein